MDAANAVAKLINDSVRYLKENAWPIVGLLAAWYFLVPKVVETLKTRSPNQTRNYDEQLRRVRQMQQLQAEQEAKLKAEELKRKQAEELKRKQAERLAQQGKEEEKKSGSSSRPDNSTRPAKPIKPNNDGPALSMRQFSSTPSYRPTRRTIRRG